MWLLKMRLVIRLYIIATDKINLHAYWNISICRVCNNYINISYLFNEYYHLNAHYAVTQQSRIDLNCANLAKIGGAIAKI